jgi:hypothetical protein
MIKRIIDGLTYNTDTATKLARRREEMVFTDLYMTRGGGFFEERTDLQSGERPTIEPLTRDAAQEWILKGEVELLSDYLAEPPELEGDGATKTEATIYIRVPTSLKQRVDAAASSASLSTNAWAIRCLERCATTAKGIAAVTDGKNAEWAMDGFQRCVDALGALRLAVNMHASTKAGVAQAEEIAAMLEATAGDFGGSLYQQSLVRKVAAAIRTSFVP